MDDIILGAKQIPNPKGIKPKLDTDAPDVERLTSGVSMHTEAPSKTVMDMSNPPVADVVVTPHSHVLHDAFAKPTKVRHSLGKGIPSPKITEN